MQASRFFLRTLVAGSAVLWAADAPGQSASRDPHIGYIFPAGGKSGGVVTVLVGGQYLRNVRDVHISGDGISGGSLLNSELYSYFISGDSLLNSWNSELGKLSPETPRSPLSR